MSEPKFKRTDKYTTICDNCLKETTIDFQAWFNLTPLMLDFLKLTKEQKDMILLMMDGALYRTDKQRGDK